MSHASVVGEYTRACYAPPRLRTSLGGGASDVRCPRCNRPMRREAVCVSPAVGAPAVERVILRCTSTRQADSTHGCGLAHYEGETAEQIQARVERRPLPAWRQSRAEKVERLRAEVQAGTYQVDAAAVAEAMLMRERPRRGRPRKTREEAETMARGRLSVEAKRRGGRPKYTPEQIAEALRLVREEGLTHREAGARAGMDHHSVYWHRRRARVRAEDEGCPVSDPDCLGDEGECHDACEADETYREAALPREPRQAPPEPVQVVAVDATTGRQVAPPLTYSVRPAPDHPPLPRAIRLLSCPEVLEVLSLPDEDLAALRRVAVMG